MFHEANKWTRKGNNEGERNTNIDIVVTRGYKKEDVRIKVKEHKTEVSDHAPIEIKIKDPNNQG